MIIPIVDSILLITFLGVGIYSIARPSKPGVIHCPGCHRRGETRLFGSYKCSGCDTFFYIDSNHKEVSSLKDAVGSFLFYSFLFVAGFAAFDFMQSKHGWDALSVPFYWGLFVSALVRRKKFPADFTTEERTWHGL